MTEEGIPCLDRGMWNFEEEQKLVCSSPLEGGEKKRKEVDCSSGELLTGLR